MSSKTSRPGIPSPAFVKRIGQIVDRRRAAEFQELRARSLLNRLHGPGMPFGWTVNPFRGCELGCRYCYARPTHEYLGHADPLEFEQRVYVKQADAGSLLADLRRARESGQEVAIGTATDPYQPAEQRFGITRTVLDAISRVPGLRVGITTKSALVTRDLDLLTRIAQQSEVWVNISLISTDGDLVRALEPRAPRPDLRLGAMAALARSGVPTRIFVMPVLPLITDGEHSLRQLLEAARSAGADEAICQALFLRTPMVRDFFLAFVRAEFPWALPRYVEMYPRPGSAPRAYREEIERRVHALATTAGFRGRSREERVRAEAPARPRQLSLAW